MCSKILGLWVRSTVLQIVDFFFFLYFYIIVNIDITWEDILAPTKSKYFLFVNSPIDEEIS